MKLSIVFVFVWISITVSCCTPDMGPMTGTLTHGLDPSWTCEPISGPVNNGPGICPDCVAELCVQIADTDKLVFAVFADEAPPTATELCSLTSVEVTQGMDLLFDDAIAIDPMPVEVGLVEVGVREPLEAASLEDPVEITPKGTFGRPTCD